MSGPKKKEKWTVTAECLIRKRIQDKVKEENPDQDVIVLHCIIHKESLCKSVLQLNHVVNPVVKLYMGKGTTAPSVHCVPGGNQCGLPGLTLPLLRPG